MDYTASKRTDNGVNPEKTMQIGLAKYTCGHCGSTFEAPTLGEASYGEFLLWSSTGKVVYVNAIEDKVYLELDKLLAQRFDNLQSDPFKASEVLQQIFGPMACEADPTGAPYMIGAQPSCTSCANGNVASWELIDPLQIVEYDIPVVTHVRWSSLTDVEKAAQIDRFVAEFESKAR